MAASRPGSPWLLRTLPSASVGGTYTYREVYDEIAANGCEGLVYQASVSPVNP